MPFLLVLGAAYIAIKAANEKKKLVEQEEHNENEEPEQQKQQQPKPPYYHSHPLATNPITTSTPKRTIIRLLPNERELSIYELPIATVTYYDCYENTDNFSYFETVIIEWFRCRIPQILNANPWLRSSFQIVDATDKTTTALKQQQNSQNHNDSSGDDSNNNNDDGELALVYDDRSNIDIDIQRHLCIFDENNPLSSSSLLFDPDTIQYNELGSILSNAVVDNNFDLIMDATTGNNDSIDDQSESSTTSSSVNSPSSASATKSSPSSMPLWKVSIIKLPPSSNKLEQQPQQEEQQVDVGDHKNDNMHQQQQQQCNRFALVVSMSHVLGDAYTYYKILRMLSMDIAVEDIVSLNPIRRNEDYINAMELKLGYEQANYIRNMVVPTTTATTNTTSTLSTIENNNNNTTAILRSSTLVQPGIMPESHVSTTTATTASTYNNSFIDYTDAPRNVTGRESMMKAFISSPLGTSLYAFETKENEYVATTARALLVSDDEAVIATTATTNDAATAVSSSKMVTKVFFINEEWVMDQRQQSQSLILRHAEEDDEEVIEQNNNERSDDGKGKEEVPLRNNNLRRISLLFDPDNMSESIEPVETKIVELLASVVDDSKSNIDYTTDLLVDDDDEDESEYEIYDIDNNDAVVSANSIISSWFFTINNAHIGFCMTNLRNRLYDYGCIVNNLDAGNYVNAMIFTPDQFKTPGHIQCSTNALHHQYHHHHSRYGQSKNVSNSDNNTSTNHELPQLLKSSDTTKQLMSSMSVNWANFYRDEIRLCKNDQNGGCDNNVCSQRLHFPLYTSSVLSSKLPDSISAINLFTASNCNNRRRAGAFVLCNENVWNDSIVTSGIIDEMIFE